MDFVDLMDQSTRSIQSIIHPTGFEASREQPQREWNL